MNKKYGRVKKMREKIKEYLLSQGIEFHSVLSYSDCREINSRLVDRQGFEPSTVVIYLLPYYAGDGINLSRYATSLDYHLEIEEINRGLERIIKEFYPDANVKGYGDHSPIDERHAASVSGLGMIGDNGLIINEKYGSFVFIGDIVTDISPSVFNADVPKSPSYCEHCGRCKRACPTKILSGEGDTCLSEITQRKGELSDNEKALMRKYNTLWGCDECQSSCPHNAAPKKTPVKFFHCDRIEHLDREILDSMDDESFNKRAFAWRKRKTVERNIDILNDK